MLDDAIDHPINNVLAAADDYTAAEQKLSFAYQADSAPVEWAAAARTAKRRAAELAIAIDGLPDRCDIELALRKLVIRYTVSALCHWPGTANLRAGAHDRVRGVANAYKHRKLSDPTLPISSEADVLVVGLGHGLDGWGVGKHGGVEVLVRDRAGDFWKFLGDAPVAISAWFKFLAAHGAVLPPGPYIFWGLQVHP
jgi:hypothetical protein